MPGRLVRFVSFISFLVTIANAELFSEIVRDDVTGRSIIVSDVRWTESQLMTVRLKTKCRYSAGGIHPDDDYIALALHLKFRRSCLKEDDWEDVYIQPFGDQNDLPCRDLQHDGKETITKGNFVFVEASTTVDVKIDDVFTIDDKYSFDGVLNEHRITINQTKIKSAMLYAFLSHKNREIHGARKFSDYTQSCCTCRHVLMAEGVDETTVLAWRMTPPPPAPLGVVLERIAGGVGEWLSIFRNEQRAAVCDWRQELWFFTGDANVDDARDTMVEPAPLLVLSEEDVGVSFLPSRELLECANGKNEEEVSFSVSLTFLLTGLDVDKEGDAPVCACSANYCSLFHGVSRTDDSRHLGSGDIFIRSNCALFFQVEFVDSSTDKNVLVAFDAPWDPLEAFVWYRVTLRVTTTKYEMRLEEVDDADRVWLTADNFDNSVAFDADCRQLHIGGSASFSSASLLLHAASFHRSSAMFDHDSLHKKLDMTMSRRIAEELQKCGEIRGDVFAGEFDGSLPQSFVKRYGEEFLRNMPFNELISTLGKWVEGNSRRESYANVDCFCSAIHELNFISANDFRLDVQSLRKLYLARMIESYNDDEGCGNAANNALIEMSLAAHFRSGHPKLAGLNADELTTPVGVVKERLEAQLSVAFAFYSKAASQTHDQIEAHANDDATVEMFHLDNDDELAEFRKDAAALTHDAEMDLGDEELTYLRLQADEGDVYSMNLLGRMLYNGERGVPRDVDRAAAFFQRAVHHLGEENALGESLYHLGLVNMVGRGVPENKTEAKRLFKLAVERNDDADAYGALGYILMEERAYAEAVPYLLKASELGIAQATHNWAYIIYNGKHRSDGKHEERKACEIWLTAASESLDSAYMTSYCYNRGNLPEGDRLTELVLATDIARYTAERNPALASLMNDALRRALSVQDTRRSLFWSYDSGAANVTKALYERLAAAGLEVAAYNRAVLEAEEGEPNSDALRWFRASTRAREVRYCQPRAILAVANDVTDRTIRLNMLATAARHLNDIGCLVQIGSELRALYNNVSFTNHDYQVLVRSISDLRHLLGEDDAAMLTARTGYRLVRRNCFPEEELSETLLFDAEQFVWPHRIACSLLLAWWNAQEAVDLVYSVI